MNEIKKIIHRVEKTIEKQEDAAANERFNDLSIEYARDLFGDEFVDEALKEEEGVE